MDKPALMVHGAAVYPDSEALREKYTLESRFSDDGEDGTYNLWMERHGVLWLPRNFAPSAKIDLMDEGDVVHFENHFTPHPEKPDQAQIVSDSYSLLSLGKSHIVQAPTGYGKTYVGCGIAALVQRRTLVITTKQDLIKQWVAAAKAVLGLDDEQIGIWRGDDVPPRDTPFVIALVQSALKGPERYSEAAYQGFGLVICDEVHRMGADQFSQAMWWLPAKLRLGLSATPYRKDGKEIVFHAHIGFVQVIAKAEFMVPKVLMKHSRWKCPRVPRKNKKTGKLKMVHLPHTSGRVMHLMPSMLKDAHRNMMIAKLVMIAKAKGRTTIVFADTMDHLTALRDACVKAGLKPKDFGWYVGLTAKVYTGSQKSREAQREKAGRKSVIFATYKMMSEGTDLPWVDTCVLGSPRSDVNQIVGRIRRVYPDKKQPLVFDIVDNDSPVFKQYAKQRLAWYKSLKAEVKVYR